MADDNYSILTDGEMRGLTEAHASGVEVIAYMALKRYHNDPEHPARCWKSAQIASAETGLRADVFTRSLSSLTAKTFTESGREVPVLTRVSKGHNGRTAVYNDNLYALRVLNDPGQVARQHGQPTKVFNNASSKAKTASNSGGVARQKRTRSKATLPSQNKELLLKGPNPSITSADPALLPSAEQSRVVDKPHKQDSTSERLQVVTETEPARAPACAAQGRTAAALPSQAEWERVARLLETEGLDALTDEDRRVYQTGHKAYAAMGYEAE